MALESFVPGAPVRDLFIACSWTCSAVGHRLSKRPGDSGARWRNYDRGFRPLAGAALGAIPAKERHSFEHCCPLWLPSAYGSAGRPGKAPKGVPLHGPGVAPRFSLRPRVQEAAAEVPASQT
jgi:hypothetical protein